MKLKRLVIEYDKEESGRWSANVPGQISWGFGRTQKEARADLLAHLSKLLTASIARDRALLEAVRAARRKDGRR